jgi:hypothetical protein
MPIHKAEFERRARDLSDHLPHPTPGGLNGCGAEYMPDEMCGDCAFIANALARVQRETADECAALSRGDKHAFCDCEIQSAFGELLSSSAQNQQDSREGAQGDPEK